MTGVILQARIDSSRLPAKALLDLRGKTVIRRAMDALRAMRRAEAFILATDADSAELLAPQAREAGFELFTGPRDDVLHRYAEAAAAFGIDPVVRATGDNPLVSAELADATVELQAGQKCDYAALSGTPIGTGVEVIDASALAAADAEAQDPYEREHVAPFLYHRADRFAIVRTEARADWLSSDRVTLDTLEDYRYIARIFAALGDGYPIPIARLVTWLRAEAAGDVSRVKEETSDDEDTDYPVGATG